MYVVSLIKRDEKMKRKGIMTMCITLLGAVNVAAQVEVKLAELGMENIRTARSEKGVAVAFEDRAFRSSYEGVGRAVKSALEGMTENGELRMAVMDANGLPQLEICMDKKLVAAYRNGEATLHDVFGQMELSCSTDRTLALLKGTETKEKSAWRPDLVVYPHLFLENTSFDRLYKYAIALAPAIEMPLWKGAELSAQVILPIVGNQKGELKQVRPGIVAVRQGFYLKKNWTLQLTAGQFTNHRLGGRGDIKWRNDNGRWELGAQAGLTVYSIFVDREWTLTRKPKLDAKLYGRVYIPRWNTELTGEAARFVYGDYGVKGSAVRHFGECTVGLYALYTEGHVNGGFNFAIPLPGRKYNRWKGMRLKPADYFTYEYGMVAWGEYVDQNLGVSYTTATGENRTRGFYQPEYIRYFLMKDCQRFED